MPYEKGEGGRPKGALNKTTQEMREVMSAIHNKFLGQLEADLHAMSPTNRWNILCKLAPFHMPTLSKNDNTNTTDGQVQIRVEYLDHTVPGTVSLDQSTALNNLGIQNLDIQELPGNQGAK